MATRAVTREFYDRLAEVYEYIFDDFDREQAVQGAILDRLLHQLGCLGACIVDPAAGIGTQAVPLAKRGWCVHASDASPAAVSRLRERAFSAGVELTAAVRDITTGLPGPLHCERAVVLLAGNSMAFVVDDNDLVAGLSGLRTSVQSSVLIGSTRDYAARPEGTISETFDVITDSRGHRTVLHRWTWSTGGRYNVELEIVGDTVHFKGSAPARGRSRDDIDGLLRRCGWQQVSWVDADVSGFYQPIFIAS
jgi:glycine/sarcosine N-methyltransferase